MSKQDGATEQKFRIVYSYEARNGKSKKTGWTTGLAATADEAREKFERYNGHSCKVLRVEDYND